MWTANPLLPEPVGPVTTASKGKVSKPYCNEWESEEYTEGNRL